MPLNASEKDRQETAANDLALKMKLELRLVRELRELFGQMSRDIEATISQTGQPPEASQYADDFVGILNRAYRRTNEKFSNRIFDFLEENKDNIDEAVIAALIIISASRGIEFEDLIKEMKAQVRMASQTFIQTNVSQTAKAITNTNQKHMDIALATSAALLADKLGRQPTNEETAKAAAKRFKKRSLARTNAIAVTETQKAAEGTKDIERQVFLNTRNGLSAAIANIKPLTSEEIWVTVGDEIVRPSHIEADGSKKNEDGVFIVQGQSLKYPGDTSLGATADNTVNCRCAAVMKIDDDQSLSNLVANSPNQPDANLLR